MAIIQDEHGLIDSETGARLVSNGNGGYTGYRGDGSTYTYSASTDPGRLGFSETNNGLYDLTEGRGVYFSPGDNNWLYVDNNSPYAKQFTYQIPGAGSGFDNKADYINGLIAAGAKFTDNDQPVVNDDAVYGRDVYLPNYAPYHGTALNNRDPATDWDSIITRGLIAAGTAAITGAGFGAFDGLGAAAGAGESGGLSGLAAGNTAVDAAAGLGGATSAGAGSVGGATSFGGLGAAGTAAGSTLMDYDWLDALNDPFSNGSIPDLSGSAGSSGVGSYGSALSDVAGGSSAIDLIQKYGQPAAKALGLTNEDGSINWGKIASGGLSAAGGLFTANAATDAAKTQSDAIVRAAQIAADAAKFKPVGITTRFGQSQFGYDANGNLTNAGYALSPDMKAQQDTLMGLSNNYLSQYGNAQAATAPMGQAAQTMFGLGNSYLATTPEQQAQKYMQEQQALLAAPRETDMANLQARLAATGRGGLMIGGGDSGALAANPELNAYYNSIRQQDLGLAAQATQGGMDYAKFGAGMVGSGGEMLRDMYGTQTAAYDPYKTALGGGKYIEGLGQNAMDMGINIGAKGTAAATNSGNMMAQGITQAAQVMQPANAYSPWGAMLSGAGNAVSSYGQPQQSYKFDPFTGKAL